MKRIIAELRELALNIAVILAMLALLAILILMMWYTVTCPDCEAIDARQQEYFRKCTEEAQSTPAAKRAWKRLYKQHGQPGAVIYEPGKEPYYVNAAGQKCWFI